MATTTILPGNASVTVAGQAVTIPLVSIGNASITLAGKVLTLNNIINAEPIDIKVVPSAGAHAPGRGTNRDNDIFWWATDNNKRGIIDVEVDVAGQIQSPTVIDNTVIDIGVAPAGTYAAGVLVEGGIDISVNLVAEWYSISGRENWVAWSKIGEASFVMDKTNEAGLRPMSWNGWAWKVYQLDDMAVVYGENGITMMYPVDSPAASFGFKDISRVGIISSHAVAGSKHVHYFITSTGDLWKLTKQGPEKLGFREFLIVLADPHLLYDEANQRLFISDGETGYVFKDGLGGGYATITGITNNYASSPSALVDIPISIMTDTVDLGHRGIKTITFVEIGTDTTENLFVALDFRYTKDEEWRTSDWVQTNPEGVARISVAAVEFRVRIKQTTFDELRIDYINVRHQRADRRFLRGPLFEQPDQGEA